MDIDKNKLIEFAELHGIDPSEVLDALDIYSKGEVVYNHTPVGVREFIEGKEFLNAAGTIWEPVMDAIVELNSGKYTEAVLTGGIGCVDSETEFLSPNGWKRISDYTDGDRVMQFNVHDQTANFTDPLSYIKKPCNMMYKVASPKVGMEQWLSPEHTVLYAHPNSDFSAFDLRSVKAHEMARRHKDNPRGFRGRFLTSFKPNTEPLKSDIRTITLQFITAITNGTYEHGRYTVKLRHLWAATRFKYIIGKARRRYVHSVTKSHQVFDYPPPWPTGGIPPEFYQLSLSQLKSLAREVFNWGICHDDNTFRSSNKEVLDFLQFVFASLGYRTNIKVRERGKYVTSYELLISESRLVGIYGQSKDHAIEEVVPADGMKYCFEVPSGFFVARRNGFVFITGNSAKTTVAIYTNAYQLYLLSCMNDPHAVFGLDKASEIIFIFQNLSEKLAKSVDYNRFRSLVSQCDYFNNHFPFDKEIESEARFPKNITCKAAGGSATAAIGQNVVGGIIDEVNFMAVVEDSKKLFGGETYNQADVLYNALAKRRKSRFMRGGTMPGVLCLVSSANYPGQFTDKKIEEANKPGVNDIFVYNKRVWDVKPKDTFGEARFNMFIGTPTKSPRIMADDEEVTPDIKPYVVAVPVEFKRDFELDPYTALKDVAGVSVNATHPFIHRIELVSRCMGTKDSVLSRESCDFSSTFVDILPDKIADKDSPRFVHIDLGLTGDSAGFAMGYVKRFVRIDRTSNRPIDRPDNTSGSQIEVLPEIHFDAILEVYPPRHEEIQFSKIRDLIYKFMEAGIAVKWVTFDSWQSVDSVQILRQRGLITDRQSIDTTNLPYEFTKSALYDNRIKCQNHTKLLKELSMLQIEDKKRKIDHPPHGSKDISDAVAGVVYGLTMRRELWSIFGVNPADIEQFTEHYVGDIL